MSVDTQIANHEIRANTYASATGVVADQLLTFVNDLHTGLYLPGIKQSDGSVVSGLDLSYILYPTFTPPAKDTSPVPVYVPPTSAKPDAPELAGVVNVTLPPNRAMPTIVTDGLFNQATPSSNLPGFEQVQPDLDVDGLLAEMDEITKPILSGITYPTLTPLNIGDTPETNTPDYLGAAQPDALPTPVDYAAQMDTTYRQMLPEMQAFIDDKVIVYLNQHEPDNGLIKNLLSEKIRQALAGDGLLPVDLETAIYVRARGRVQNEFAIAEQAYYAQFEKDGMAYDQGALVAGIQDARLKGADALANISNDIYVERTRKEAEYIQFAIGAAYSDVASVRGAVLNYVGSLANTIQQASAFAASRTDFELKKLDHLLARANLQVSIMDALGREFKVRLDASLARTEAFRVTLEAEKLKKDVELSQIAFIEAQLRSEELQVRLYSALQESVVRKGELQKMKTVLYQIQSDIFKNITTAKLAEYDVFKASIDGDKAKLEAELSKLKILDSQIAVDNLNLEAQVKAIGAAESYNKALIDTYRVGADVFKLDLEAAIQTFTAAADVKKLYQSIYGVELEAAVKVFGADFDAVKLQINTVLEQYKLSVLTAVEEGKFTSDKMKIAEDATKAVLGAFGDMAKSALGSLNTVVSSAISASA